MGERECLMEEKDLLIRSEERSDGGEWQQVTKERELLYLCQVFLSDGLITEEHDLHPAAQLTFPLCSRTLVQCCHGSLVQAAATTSYLHCHKASSVTPPPPLSRYL